MSLENVRQRLAADAKVAEVAEVFRCPVRPCAAAGAEVAEVAEVFGGRVAPVGGDDVHRLQRSCRGFSKTYAPATHSQFSTCEDRAEVAEVFHSLTRAQARAGEEEWGGEHLQPMQPLRAPRQATILRHCRCSDCLKFSNVASEYFCSEYIGGTAVVWATGKRRCDPAPDAWHYCASYRGPQISRDVWAFPRSTAQKEGPRQEGGRPGGEPCSDQPGENWSRHSSYAAEVQSPQKIPCRRRRPGRSRAGEVGAGSNIAGEPANPMAFAEDRDVARPGVNGSFLGTYAEDRDGNSRTPVLCLLRARTYVCD